MAGDVLLPGDTAYAGAKQLFAPRYDVLRPLAVVRPATTADVATAVKFARCEGTFPAPESAHAIHSAVQHALKARDAGTPTVILFNLSGHGLFDLAAYESYLTGKMDLNA